MVSQKRINANIYYSWVGVSLVLAPLEMASSGAQLAKVTKLRSLGRVLACCANQQVAMSEYSGGSSP